MIKVDGWRFTIISFSRIGMGRLLPNISKMLRRLDDHKLEYFGILDSTSGYHQPSPPHELKTVHSLHNLYGVIRMVKSTYGITRSPAPSYFQCMLASVVLVGLIYIICEVYIDDLIINLIKYCRSNHPYLEKI